MKLNEIMESCFKSRRFDHYVPTNRYKGFDYRYKDLISNKFILKF